MADFRKWILALSVLALVFTGVASAQVTGVGAPMTCVAGTAVPPQLRTEGYTELVGDITLDCTGGTAPLDGALIPQANIVVNLQGTITSRLIGSGSEALLMIDEPGSGLGGVGPSEPQFLCTTPLIGCQAYVGTITGSTAPVTTSGGTAPAQNVFQGVTNGSQVTFFGVPILAPVTSTFSRVYRITNLRVNANGITGGGSGFQSVLAQISVNNVQVSVTNPTVTVGYIQQSFAGSFRNGGTDSTGLTGANTGPLTTDNEYQCTPVTNKLVAVLRFSELFGTAFKTRVNAGGVYPGTIGTAIQNIPGAIYNSESGFTSAFSGNGATNPLPTAGLADYGTRLKAVFANIPAGVSVYVSTVNLIGTAGTGGAASTSGTTPAVPGASGTGSPEYAFLVNTETGVDPVTAVAATTGGPASGWLLPVSATGGSEAIWEVGQALANTIENFDFGVYITFTNGVTPSPQGISATLSYAPTPDSATFSAAAAGVAQSSLTIPRFANAAASSGTPFLNVNLCTTALLFPYVTTAFLVPGQSGFDTGISIANTTMDPFNTTTQQGTCTMYWYGGTPGATSSATPPSSTVLGAGGVGSSIGILPGTTGLTLASQSVPADWSGYMIALCNFQYAHGYASVTDVGVRNIMASYLALVITDRVYGGCYGGGTNCANVENLNN
ncbi:MAG: hypothetical protein WCB12_19485 [Bryobacteraceae bacterium]